MQHLPRQLLHREVPGRAPILAHVSSPQERPLAIAMTIGHRWALRKQRATGRERDGLVEWSFPNQDAAGESWAFLLRLPHTPARRIVERPQARFRGNVFAGDLDFVPPRLEEARIRKPSRAFHITQAQWFADRVAEHPRGDSADEDTLAPDRLVVIEMRRLVLQA